MKLNDSQKQYSFYIDELISSNGKILVEKKYFSYSKEHLFEFLLQFNRIDGEVIMNYSDEIE